ncbi:MAG: hypothetical protein GY862_02170, partial [Gammaproteobacteria bacterium]|nr:hypothetical protein [Gammaproteobacteria bacterium]
EKCRGRTPEMPLENIYRVNSSPALRMKPLYLDDELRIEGTPGCFLEVRIGVEIKILHTADSPFSITEGSIRQAPSLWDRLLASLTGGPKQRSVTAGFVNRGGIYELFVPLFVKQPELKLLNAARPGLALEWQGGLPPYEIQVFDTQDNPLMPPQFVAALPEQTRHSAYLDFTRLSLLPGPSYLIEVRSQDQDACLDKLQNIELCISAGHFMLVPSAALPSLPAEFKDFPGNLRQRFYAVWLLVEKPAWTLEAYQILNGLAEQGDEQANLLLTKAFH